MRAFFYSAFIFRNGQNPIPSFLLSGAERTECTLRIKIQDGGRWDKRCRFKRAPAGPVGEEVRIHFLTQWKIASLYFFVPKVRDIFSGFSSRKRQFAKWLPRTWKKIATLHRQQTARAGGSALLLRSEVRKCEDNNKSGRHICYAIVGRVFYARNPNYSEHYVPTILIPELWIKKTLPRCWIRFEREGVGWSRWRWMGRKGRCEGEIDRRYRARH